MELKNKFIRSRIHLRENFTIREIMKNIDQVPAGYVDFVENYLKKSEPVDQMILDCLEERLDIPAEKSQLQKQITELQPGFWQENEQNIHKLLADEVILTEEVRLIYLFLMLHIQAHCPITEAGLQYMQERLQTVGQQAWDVQLEQYKASGRIIEIADGKSLELPGGHGKEGKLVQIQNISYLPIQVRIQGTQIIRGLFHGETLYGVKAADGYIGFMPRLLAEESVQAMKFMMSDETVLLDEQNCPCKIMGKGIYQGEKQLVQAESVVSELAVYGQELLYRTLGSPKVWRYEYVND
ncbi:MAG: hypothetical protein IJ315_01315 [Firmicutes bacterium]|nr:hypothetical protein [Bacillota bacterium]